MKGNGRLEEEEHHVRTVCKASMQDSIGHLYGNCGDSLHSSNIVPTRTIIHPRPCILLYLSSITKAYLNYILELPSNATNDTIIKENGEIFEVPHDYI